MWLWETFSQRVKYCNVKGNDAGAGVTLNLDGPLNILLQWLKKSTGPNATHSKVVKKMGLKEIGTILTPNSDIKN